MNISVACQHSLSQHSGLRGLQKALLLSCAAVVALTSSIRADIIIDGYTAATNDRFTNNGAFIAGGFNLSGVGQMTGSLAWGTAISRNVIISAAHAPPVGTINFYTNNDPTGAPVVRTVMSGVQIPNTDLYLAVLDSNLPASIVHYNYATQALSGPNGSLVGAGIYQNLNAYLFGRSPAAHPNWQDQAVGRNRISGYVENVNFNGNSDVDALLMFYDSVGHPDYVQYEAYLQGGDSGGPLFVDIGGQLVLLGTNAFINSGGLGGNPPFFSGVNYTGNQAAFINEYIVANIPEPSAITLLAIGNLGMLLIRRRRPA
jgi:hypothetical protein